MFLFSYGIACNVVKSDHFRKFVHKLNLNYKPPSRKTLGGPILDRIYAKIINKNYFPKPEKSIMLLDEWKNSN